MTSRATDDDIEVLGRSIQLFLASFAVFKKLPSDALLAEGIGTPGRESVVIDDDQYYAHSAWLRAFRVVASAIGDEAIFGVGLKVPAQAAFPPSVTDIHAALRNVDVEYHLQHRKAGRVMYDRATGTTLSGIGHYGCERAATRSRVLSVCTSPYPCEFDRGLLTSVARRFEYRAWVDHEPGPCRKSGSDACVYAITW